MATLFQRLFVVRSPSSLFGSLPSAAAVYLPKRSLSSSAAISSLTPSLLSSARSTLLFPPTASINLSTSLRRLTTSSAAETITYTNPAYPLVGKVEPKNPPTVYIPPNALNKEVRSVYKVDATTREENLKPLEQSFAVVTLSGKQYKVTAGDTIHTDKIPFAEPGDVLQIDKVLLVGSKENTYIGTPVLPNARVVVLIEQQTKAEKIIVFKKKRRKNYRRQVGCKPEITVLRVLEVLYAPELFPNAPTFQHFYPEPKPSLSPTKPAITTDLMLQKLQKFDEWREPMKIKRATLAERKRDIKRGMNKEGVAVTRVRKTKQTAAEE